MTTTVSQEAREAAALQEAWDSIETLPPIIFTDTEANALLQSIRQQAERGEAWRPIETAPKDWTDVLVFSPEHEGFNCNGVFSAFYDTDEAGWSTHGPGHNVRLHPTHWQPLPTPPEAAA